MVIISERVVRVRERFEDTRVLALKREEEVQNQRMPEASRRWRSQGTGSSPRASRRNTALPTS